MEYFQTPLPGDGDGVCSDRECPCKGTRIPRGEGYLYISIDCCGFRWDCRTPGEVETKIERLSKEAGFKVVKIGLAPDIKTALLVCETGARKEGLDLEIAARDAKHWWATEQVPFRPTPRVGEPAVAFKGRASPPGGGQPVQLDKPLVHVLTLKEGAPGGGSFVKEVFDSFPPGMLKDSPAMRGAHTGNTFYEPLEDVAVALLARDYGEYLNEDYDVRTVERRQSDGTRMVILTVFANRPKTVAPAAPARQTNSVDVPPSAQKDSSGWLSKVRSLFATG